MSVIDFIKHTDRTAFSLEVLPPLKGTGIEKLYQTVDLLREFDPKYINITTHRSEYVYKDLGNNLYARHRVHHRPGTVAVAAAKTLRALRSADLIVPLMVLMFIRLG